MSTYPPDHWTVSGSGVTWADDFSVVPQATLANLMGSGSIKIASRAPAAQPAGDPTMWSPYTPIDISMPYEFRSIVRASSIAGGNTVLMAVYWYNGALTFQGTSTIHNAVLGAATTWEHYTETLDELSALPNSRYARVVIAKNNTDFDVWVDYANLKQAQPKARIYEAASTSIPNASWTKVGNATEDYSFGMGGVGAGEITLRHSGYYHIDGVVRFDDTIDDTKAVYAAIYTDGGTQLIGGSGNAQGAAQAAAATVSGDLWFDADDIFELRVWQNSGGARDTLAGSANTSLNVHRLP